MTTTIKDVAKEAGVSISTVSRVLNNPLAVRKDKRLKVKKVIKEMNYSPNSLARGLIYKKTNTIGVFIPDISNQFTASLVKGIEEKGNELGYTIILCDTGHDKERILNYLDVLIGKQIDGVIFSSQHLEEEYYNLLQNYNIPIVLAATESFDHAISSVKVDNVRASYTATEFLIQNQHKKIVMISGPKEDKIAGIPRLKGFIKAHEELLEQPVAANQIAYSTFSYDSAFEAMQTLYEANNGDIDAVFCASDEIAMGAISYLKTKSRAVPDDISVMGFDDSPMARMFIPKLTTLKQPIFEIGRRSVEKLSEIIRADVDESVNHVCIYMPHEVMVRESVRLK